MPSAPRELSLTLSLDDARMMTDSLTELRKSRVRTLNAIAYRKAYGLDIPQKLLDEAAVLDRAERLRRSLAASISRAARKGA